MNLYLIEVETVSMTLEQIANELSVMGEALGAIGGGLLCSGRHDSANHWTGYVHVESGQAVRDLFEASDLAVVRIEFVGASHGIHRNGSRALDFMDAATAAIMGLGAAAAEGDKPGLP